MFSALINLICMCISVGSVSLMSLFYDKITHYWYIKQLSKCRIFLVTVVATTVRSNEIIILIFLYDFLFFSFFDHFMLFISLYATTVVILMSININIYTHIYISILFQSSLSSCPKETDGVEWKL